MKEHYVSYEQSVKLKELGFDWECNRYYTNGYANHDPEDLTRVVKLHYDSPYNHNQVISADGPCYSAPRLDQAQAWMKDCKGIGVEPFASIPDKMWAYRLYHTKGEKFGMTLVISNKSVVVYEFNTYELALSAGIDKALELLGKEDKQ